MTIKYKEQVLFELCGFKKIYIDTAVDGGAVKEYVWTTEEDKVRALTSDELSQETELFVTTYPPNYSSDLNCIKKAEDILIDEGNYETYCTLLEYISERSDGCGGYCAAAWQRMEAMLILFEKVEPKESYSVYNTE